MTELAEPNVIVATKFNPTIVTLQYTDHDIDCPFCMSRVQIFIDVAIEGGNAHRTGSSGFHEENFSVSLEKKIKEVRFVHTCGGPRGNKG